MNVETNSVDYIPQLMASIKTIIDIQAALIANFSKTARTRNKSKNKRVYVAEITAKQRKDLDDLIDIAKSTVEVISEIILTINTDIQERRNAES